MRAIFAIVGLALLALVLTSLSLRAVDADADTFDRALADLDRLARSEGALRGDLLAARAGLLRNYDPVVQQMDAMYASLDSLRDDTKGQPQVRTAVDQLSETMGRQEQVVEQFKSDNALLQNSLTQFRSPRSIFPTLGAGDRRPADQRHCRRHPVSDTRTLSRALAGSARPSR